MNFDNNEVDKFLNILKKAKDQKTIESYTYIKNILNSIEFPIPFIRYPKGTRFVRCRLHDNAEDMYFTKVSELSYRTDIQNIQNFGRANEPGQSIFYCADNDWISFVETSEVARNLKDKAVEYISGSIWIAMDDIYAISVLNNSDIENIHPELENLSKPFEKNFQIQNDEYSKAYSKLLNYLSQEFSRESKGDSNHYKITAAFTNYIFDNIEQADCILYPSSLDTTRGFNFAFKTISVDKKLKFHAAMRRKMVENGEKNYMQSELIESKKYENPTTIIEWS